MLKKTSNKAAASGNSQAQPLGYVEDFSEASTPLGGFSILLFGPALRGPIRAPDSGSGPEDQSYHQAPRA